MIYFLSTFWISLSPACPALRPTSLVFLRLSSDASSIPATPVIAPPTINPVINPLLDFFVFFFMV